jgi:hypothetical protein
MRDRRSDGRDAILSRLTQLAESGTPPNAIALLPEHAGIVDRAIASFGNLAVARQQMAGGRSSQSRTGGRRRRIAIRFCSGEVREDCSCGFAHG